jgi:hypothetical protein
MTRGLVAALSLIALFPTHGIQAPQSADKDWCTRYAQALIPKLRIGGCLTAHNVSPRGGGGR